MQIQSPAHFALAEFLHSNTDSLEAVMNVGKESDVHHSELEPTRREGLWCREKEEDVQSANWEVRTARRRSRLSGVFHKSKQRERHRKKMIYYYKHESKLQKSCGKLSSLCYGYHYHSAMLVRYHPLAHHTICTCCPRNGSSYPPKRTPILSVLDPAFWPISTKLVRNGIESDL